MDMNSCCNITGSGIASLSNIKELKCANCDNLEDEHIIALLHNAPFLEILDLGSCQKLTFSIIEEAIEATSNRKNNVILKMSTWLKYELRDKELQKTSSLLILDLFS